MKKRISIAVLVLLAAAAGVLGYTRYQEAKQVQERARVEEVTRQSNAAAMAAIALHEKREAERREVADLGIDQAVPGNYKRPVSDWQAGEKAFYEKILLAGKFDVVVFPLQVQQWGFDAATRSLMTAELAAAVAQTGKQKVADPYLVARAVGDGQRQFSVGDFHRIATAVGAKRIVWGYAGHNSQGKMVVTVMVQDWPGPDPARTRWTPAVKTKFENIAFDDDNPPLAAYQAMLPQIIKGIGYDPAGLAGEKPESRLNLAALPDSPLQLTEPADEPARDAYTFLLFAALTPDYITRTRERFAEKAMLVLSRMSPSSPEYRALLARAYMTLSYRMAALKVLGEPKTEEERGLAAVLNGNLPDVRAFIAKEKHPVKRLLLKLDEINIALHYDVTDSNRLIAELKAMGIPGQIWPFLVARAATEDDAWVQHENAHLKMLLDHELPVKNYSLEDIMRAGASVGEPAKLQATVDLSVFNHGRQFLEAGAAKWCCEFSLSRPGVSDYMDLLQAMGHDNLIRRITFFSSIQGVPQRAVEYSNTLDAVYKGYPYYMVERSKAESRLSRNASGPEKEALLKSAYENAFNAMYWEQGQSHISNYAQHEVNSLGRSDFGLYGNFYYNDIPFRPYYWTWAAGGSPQVIGSNNEAALKNATWEIRTVSQLIGHYRLRNEEPQVKALLKSIEGRFIGSPQRNELLASEELRSGNIKAAELHYRNNIRLIPNYQKSYSDLGKIFFESGDVREASRLFLSWPGFRKGASENRIGIANFAYEVGSYFYWSGHFDLAIPFYRIAEAQQTGASSEMTSALRLKLLAGDMGGALLGSYQRARRYNDSYAYRDYLGMLHASGHSKDAWAGFGTLIKEIPKPHVWETALTGHHIAGATEAEVAEWVQQEAMKNTAERTNTAARYLARFVTTDRIPSRDLPALIDSVDAPVWQLEGQSPWVVRPKEDGSTGLILGPDVRGGHSFLPLGMFANSKKHRVRSPLSYFTEAYRAIKLGDFAAAKKAFDEAAKLYDMTAQSAYMLPYYALAAAKVGDTAAVEATLRRFAQERRRFDYQLARAVLAASAGKTDDAMQAFALARYRRPYTEDRPLLTQYTFGDICELLTRTTGNSKIRGLAVDWARQNQRSEPWQSWSYAIEAALTANATDRKRALAMLYYLDPKSELLSKFRKPEIDEAVGAYAKSNPFLKKASGPAPENPI